MDEPPTKESITPILMERSNIPQYMKEGAEQVVDNIISKYEYDSKAGDKKIDWHYMVEDMVDFNFEKSREEIMTFKKKDTPERKPQTPQVPEVKTRIEEDELVVQNYQKIPPNQRDNVEKRALYLIARFQR